MNRSRFAGAVLVGRSSIGDRVKGTAATTSSHPTQRHRIIILGDAPISARLNRGRRPSQKKRPPKGPEKVSPGLVGAKGRGSLGTQRPRPSDGSIKSLTVVL